MGGNGTVIKPGRPSSDQTETRLSISLSRQGLQCDLINHHLLLLLVLSGANRWLLFVKDETLTCEGSAIKTNVNFIWVRCLRAEGAARFTPIHYVSAPGLLGGAFPIFSIAATQTKTEL